MTFLFDLLFWLVLGAIVMGTIYLKTNLIENQIEHMRLDREEVVTVVILGWIFWPLTLMASSFYLAFLRLKHIKAHQKKAASHKEHAHD
jgi:hypothetical protein